jgi:hypothetical protein
LETGRPTLWLEDLIIALKARQNRDFRIGCSIDPTAENMARLQAYLSQNSTPTTAARATARFREMDDILGLQEISIWGVPGDSHFARILVEADYRMKRIALGVVPSGVKGVRSHLAMLTPGGNTLQRWWFVPLYDAVKVNNDRSVFQISGPRAQLLAQEEVTDSAGNRSDAVTTRKSIELFAQQFSENLPELAKAHPVFAQMQNLFDLSLLAALADREGALGDAEWSFNGLLRIEELAAGGYAVPKYVRSTSTFKRASGGLLLGLVGGVTLNIDRTAAEPEQASLPTAESWKPASGTTTWWWNTTPTGHSVGAN